MYEYHHDTEYTPRPDCGEQPTIYSTRSGFSGRPARGGGSQPPRRPGKGAFLAVACACLVTSSLAGFGGGWLASSMADPAAASAESAPAQTADAQVQARPNDSAGVMTTSQVVGAVSDSVVEINTEVETTNLFRQTVTAQAAGSGVVISEDGYVITNNHVVEGAKQITVRLKDETSYPATLVGTDPQTDVAVIKIEAQGLSAAKMGSSSSLEVGDDVIAIGNPLGELGGTVTNGIVSAVSRQVTIGDETMELLQTNAAINPGNSGGGLFNSRGELIGIVVAKSSGTGVEGLGFAIPIDTAKRVADDLIAHGYVTGRGELGVSVINISDPLAALQYRLPGPGVYVAGFQEGSAAQKAGVKVGDGITAVNGEKIATSQELKAQLEKYRAGDAVELTLQRDSGETAVTVTLQESVPESAREQQVAI